MSLRTLILLIAAAVMAFGTATFVRRYLTAEEKPQNPRVLIARIDIPKGSFVQAAKYFDWVDWTGKPDDPSLLREGKTNPDKLNGAVARVAIAKGNPITETAIVKSSEGGFMAAVLEPGKRAISIAVDATTGNAGFIFPGDHVDLIVTHRVPTLSFGMEGAQKDMLASETFVKDVRILAVDQTIDNPDNAAILAKTVTLEVSERQAEAVNVARDLGKISLALRSLSGNATAVPQPPESAGPGFTRDTDVSKITNPEAPSAFKVQVFRGEKHEEMQFIGH